MDRLCRSAEDLPNVCSSSKDGARREVDAAVLLGVLNATRSSNAREMQESLPEDIKQALWS